MRHPGQVGDDGLAADILAERQRQRRLQGFIFACVEDLAERDQGAVFIGDLKADTGLARDHIHHPDADHGQRAGQIFRQIADLAALHARRRVQLKARDHRPRMHRHDRDRDAEILQL